MNDVTPFIGPIIELLKSRKGLMWIASAVVTVLIAYLPAFEALRDQIMDVLLVCFTGLTGLLVATIAYEDGKLKFLKPLAPTKVDWTPIWSPVVAMLKSRKFVVSVVGVVVGFLVTNIPSLVDVQPQLTEIFMFCVTGLVSILFGSISWEDGKASEARRGAVAAMSNITVTRASVDDPSYNPKFPSKP